MIQFILNLFAKDYTDECLSIIDDLMSLPPKVKSNLNIIIPPKPYNKATRQTLALQMIIAQNYIKRCRDLETFIKRSIHAMPERARNKALATLHLEVTNVGIYVKHKNKAYDLTALQMTAQKIGDNQTLFRRNLAT